MYAYIQTGRDIILCNIYTYMYICLYINTYIYMNIYRMGEILP